MVRQQTYGKGRGTIIILSSLFQKCPIYAIHAKRQGPRCDTPCMAFSNLGYVTPYKDRKSRTSQQERVARESTYQ